MPGSAAAVHPAIAAAWTASARSRAEPIEKRWIIPRDHGILSKMSAKTTIKPMAYPWRAPARRRAARAGVDVALPSRAARALGAAVHCRRPGHRRSAAGRTRHRRRRPSARRGKGPQRRGQCIRTRSSSGPIRSPIARARPIGKPGDHERAVAQLTELSGRTVVFHTGLALLDAASGRVPDGARRRAEHVPRSFPPPRSMPTCDATALTTAPRASARTRSASRCSRASKATTRRR